MNLKESFRYQKFLESMIYSASRSLTSRDHCLIVTKFHKPKSVNPEAEDFEETMDTGEFIHNDIVVDFIISMIQEKEKLSVAIGEAKASIGFDLDAALETNKARQAASETIKNMLRIVGSKTKGVELGYRFDINGVQQPYRYESETISVEAYDRDAAKLKMRGLVTQADKVSASIDAALINTNVDYTPPYDVNEQYDDVIEMFAGQIGAE